MLCESHPLLKCIDHPVKPLPHRCRHLVGIARYYEEGSLAAEADSFDMPRGPCRG